MKPYHFLDRLPPRRLSGSDGRASLIVTCPELSSIAGPHAGGGRALSSRGGDGPERVCRVLWKRFGNGTVMDPRQIRGEGLRLLCLEPIVSL